METVDVSSSPLRLFGPQKKLYPPTVSVSWGRRKRNDVEEEHRRIFVKIELACVSFDACGRSAAAWRRKQITLKKEEQNKDEQELGIAKNR